MLLSTVIALASSAGLASAIPAKSLYSRGVPAFPAGTSFDILLNKGDGKASVKGVASENFQVIDLDLFDTDAPTISDLKSTKAVVCYFSAGSREDWRPDAGDFKQGDTGKGLDGWAGENWVNVKSDNVRAIMKKRIEMAAQKGCTAIDPDNVDGFDGNQDGMGLDKSAYADYIKFMAAEAAKSNMAIGLKNALDLIPDVINVIQFAVNEQCHENNECDKYKPMTQANKAVFNIEYGGNDCSSPSGVKLSTVIKPADQALNTLGGACDDNKGDAQLSGGNSPAPTSAQAEAGSTGKPTAISLGHLPTTSAVKQPSITEGGAQPTPTGTGEEEGGEDGGDDGDDDEPTPTPTYTSKGRPSKSFGTRPTAHPTEGSHRHHNSTGPHTINHHQHHGSATLAAHPTSFPGHRRHSATPAAPTPTGTDGEDDQSQGEGDDDDNDE